MKSLLRIVTLCALAFLTACSQLGQQPTQEPLEPVSSWEEHQQKLLQLTHYQASGKLGYIDPSQRQSLNFTWSKSADKTELNLFTFLGTKVMSLTITPRYARVENSDGDIFSHLDANYLIKNLTGLDIPIEHFDNWIIGLPGANDAFTLNPQFYLQSTHTTTSEAKWTVDYTEYTQAQQFTLPQNMKLNHQQTKLIVSVSKWTISE